MTISIHIEAHPDRGDMGHQVEQAMSALGFFRVSHKGRVILDTHVEKPEQVRDAPASVSEALDAMDATLAGADTDAPIVTGVVTTSLGAKAPALDTRAIGSASEGRARRTKVEIAEDGEFEKLAAEKGLSLEHMNILVARNGREKAAELARRIAGPITITSMKMLPDDATSEDVAREFAAISTGEERVGPEDEQDAADEAAETEKSGLAPIDVLRRLLGDYQKAHGMPAAVKLCQEGGLIGAPIHDLDEAGIEKAIAAMSVSSLSPEAKAEPKPVETVAPKSKADLIEAMMRYGDKFDGTREQKDMKFTLVDCPAIFTEVFGPEVTKLSLVPENGYGKAVAAIEQAIATDPFGRAK